jgi:muramoyltetrapeptide carboxypeptidase
MRLERIEACVRYLEGQGYRVKLGQHLLAKIGPFAGSDADRAADLNAMIRDAAVRAIFAIRGGYGTPRILQSVDYSALRRTPKIIAGFSDITALQLAIYRRCGLVTFSGALPGPDFAETPVDAFTEEHFWRLLTSASPIGTFPNPDSTPILMPRTTLVPGEASGPLLGGCITMVVQLLGTRYNPDYKDAILVLEDVNEEPYRIDRMLTHLRNARVNSKISGCVLGQFQGCKVKDPALPHFTIDQVTARWAEEVNKPTMTGLAYGHIRTKLTLPLGLPVRLDATRCHLESAEPAVTD